MLKRAALFVCLLFCIPAMAQTGWWRQNNLRVIQFNLPDYKAATINPDTLVNSLVEYSANTLIINAGGIMAFYPTKLDFQYTNPYMKPNTLGDVIAKCHQHHIRVIVRFDFSRVHESIFKAHPDWCYISPKGERIINTNMYCVSINAPYVQQCAFKIVSEVMDDYPIDGIFLNMPGYQVNNAYEGKYMGIDQNQFDKERFAQYSNGMKLPTEENKADPVYQKYLEFKQYTVDDWSRRLFELVKAKNPQIAICTYTDKYVDIIRHESQSNTSLPYWPYTASDNVNNASHSYPGHIISNASIQQLSFQSRYNAVEPQEVAIRLYENIANGSGLDMSMMGDFQNYEDERNFDVIRNIYAFHKKYEPYFGNYKPVAKIALISTALWPAGLPMQEYRGIQLMLKERHIQFDVIVQDQIQNLAAKIKSYKLIILPDVTGLTTQSVQVLKDAATNGTGIIATNTALSDDAAALMGLFGTKVVNKDYDGAGNYLVPDDKTIFKDLKGQRMISLKFNTGQYDLSAADHTYMPILGKGRPGPPEIIGGHEPTGYYAMSVKKQGAGIAVLLPFNIGRLYYQTGYQQYKNIFMDALEYTYPQAGDLLTTNAPARVEAVLQQYEENIPGPQKHAADGLILHLINLTGFSGATYFEPFPMHGLSFKIHSDYKPEKVMLMTTKQPLAFTWEDNYVSFTVNDLDAFQSVLIDK